MARSGKDLIKFLEKYGWTLERIRGSHHIMIKEGKTITVPVHGNKTLGKGLEMKIIKQCGIKK
ncbi:MAG: type II toxin-antitoxin system HicA family toxin [Bacteriovoracaceae bacterium]|nr:type II toxin-antitoxin system HicA family toxin [Bacteriovoracaceae bacterium]